MALINSTEYNGLGSYSNSSSKKGPGKFKIVYITGKPRSGETVGKIQVVKEYDNENKPIFILNNVDSIRFIMMFMKRVRQMVKKINGKEKTICFSFNDEEGSISSSNRPCPSGPDRKNGFCNDCKYQYLFAGALLDSNNKPVKIKNDKNEEETVLIYFRNSGMKFKPAMDLLEKLEEKSIDLPALSDNPEMERNIITPRRFIIEVVPGIEVSKEWGDISVFKYDPIMKLPDDNVKKILDQSNQFIKDFEEQFNISKYISKNISENTTTPTGIPFQDATENKISNKEDNSPEVKSTELVNDIDLGF